MQRFLLTIVAGLIVLLSCNKKSDAPASTVPLITTSALTNVYISAGSAIAGGSIVSDGGATIRKSGIVWSNTNNTPTMTDNLIASTIVTGTFTTNIAGLALNTTYYFRAFATNSVGTGYGNVITLTTSGDSVRFTYNGMSVAYGIITSLTTGKKWLDRNLGAKRQATSFDDHQAYGDLFQWGRLADGHQLINWTSSSDGASVNGTTSTLATSDNPGHSNFVITSGDPHDWRNDNNKNRWAANPQGPCPTGWHVPTIVEWRAELGSGDGSTPGGITDRNTAYSKLKLTIAGLRLSDGQVFHGMGNGPGISGHYWSSGFYTFQGHTNGNPDVFEFYSSSASSLPELMANGYCVRCIKDN